MNLRLGIVSTYYPRKCGIATFTADLRDALTEVEPSTSIRVAAIDNSGLKYGPEVVAVINQDSPEDYRAAARSLVEAGVDIVLIEHEYGIFSHSGDETYAGHQAVDLAEALTELGTPYAVTLHTVLSQPGEGQRKSLQDLCFNAAQVFVFTETARDLAIHTGVAPAVKLAIIPHGAPMILRQKTPDLVAEEASEVYSQ